MPTAIRRHRGDQIDYTPSGSAVVPGQVVVLNDMVGISSRDIAVGELGALAVTGVYEMPKATGGGTGIALGAAVYWDAAAGDDGQVTVDDTDTPLGHAAAAAADGDATVRVRLQPTVFIPTSP